MRLVLAGRQAAFIGLAVSYPLAKIFSHVLLSCVAAFRCCTVTKSKKKKGGGRGRTAHLKLCTDAALKTLSASAVAVRAAPTRHLREFHVVNIKCAPTCRSPHCKIKIKKKERKEKKKKAKQLLCQVIRNPFDLLCLSEGGKMNK